MQPVKIYTTGSCPYCIQAKQLLKERGVTQLDEIRVDQVAGGRQKMTEITGRRTVPQIFVGRTHVGGCDDRVVARGHAINLIAASASFIWANAHFTLILP